MVNSCNWYISTDLGQYSNASFSLTIFCSLFIFSVPETTRTRVSGAFFKMALRIAKPSVVPSVSGGISAYVFHARLNEQPGDYL